MCNTATTAVHAHHQPAAPPPLPLDLSAALPAHLLERCLVGAGAWRVGGSACGPAYAPWSVCRAWRDAMWRSGHHEQTLLHAMGEMFATQGRKVGKEVLRRAARCRGDSSDEGGGFTPASVESAVFLRRALELHGSEVAWWDGALLMEAAGRGDVATVRLLLAAGMRGDVQGGWALVRAAEGGHVGVVRLLLSEPERAPRADCHGGEALVAAAGDGHEEVVRVLLSWPQHAPRANSRDGDALLMACWGGHESVVRMLLDCPLHAAHAGCRDGRALALAAAGGHEKVVRLLLARGCRPDGRGGAAALRAAHVGGRVGIVKLLQGTL